MDKQNKTKQQRIMRVNLYNDDDRQYLQMMQANIERMANNSANSKVWMINLITAFVTIGSLIPSMRGWLFLGIIPIILFWYIDKYYLQLERGMRNRERDFLNKQKSGNNDEYENALYNFCPLKCDMDDKEKGFVKTKGLWLSRSIAPFYCIPLVTVVLLTIIINWNAIHVLLCNR